MSEYYKMSDEWLLKELRHLKSDIEKIKRIMAGRARWRNGHENNGHINKGSQLLLEWSRAVKERDKFTCKMCETVLGQSDELHAHHIYSKKDHPSLKYVVENGISLCKTCHIDRVHNNGELCEAIEEAKEMMLDLDWDEIEQWNEAVG
jgi:hypothetical protein